MEHLKNFEVGKTYGRKDDKFKDDDKNTESKDIMIKIVKRTKKYVYISNDDKRYVKLDDEGYEYLSYPFNISCRRTEAEYLDLLDRESQGLKDEIKKLKEQND